VQSFAYNGYVFDIKTSNLDVELCLRTSGQLDSLFMSVSVTRSRLSYSGPKQTGMNSWNLELNYTLYKKQNGVKTRADGITFWIVNSYMYNKKSDTLPSSLRCVFLEFQFSRP